MNGQDFIAFAARIAASGTNDPASCRSSISRSYYGAFHLAREFLGGLGYRCRSENEHHWVQRHFLNCKVNEVKEIGRLLANLHESRKEADYDLHLFHSESSQQARFCVERAERLRIQVDSCREPTLALEIKSDMDRYRRTVSLS